MIVHMLVCILIHPKLLFFLQITETENMMDRIVSGLSESSIKVRLAAVRYGVKRVLMPRPIFPP